MDKKPVLKRLPGGRSVWEMPDGRRVPFLAGGALLGAYIDSRTQAAPAGAASGSFTHGLPAIPDMVVVDYQTTSASIASPGPLTATFDATNVTYANPGNSTMSVPTVVTIRAHTLIR